MSSASQKFILCVCMHFVFINSAYSEELVDVLLTGPEKAAVGASVAFEVELVNRSGKQLSQLRVIDYFDKGLKHPVSASPIEQSGTILLLLGNSAEQLPRMLFPSLRQYWFDQVFQLCDTAGLIQ